MADPSLRDLLSLSIKVATDDQKRKLVGRRLKNLKRNLTAFMDGGLALGRDLADSTTHLNDAVGKAFKDDNERKFAENYLNQIYSNSQRTEEKLRKSLIRLFLLGFISYLLLNSSTNELLIGFIKVNDFTLIIKLMPLLISINFYELMSLIIGLSMQIRLTHLLIKFLHEPISDTGLDAFLFPSTTPHYLHFITMKIPGLKKYPYLFSYIILVFIIVVSPFIIEIFIIYMCLLRFGIYDSLLQATIITSFIINVIICMMLSVSEESPLF